jgi:DNA-binding transcriptional MocR family regulator
MRELAPPNKRQAEFVQLYRSAMRAMRKLALEAPMAHAVLYVLLERINERNALVVSNATLCKLTGKSRATITRAIAELRSRNYIETLRAGNLTVIVVNQRVAWTTDTALRGRLAVFDARVIVSEDEQDNPQLEREPELMRLPPVLVPPEIATTLDDEDPTVAGQQPLPID